MAQIQIEIIDYIGSTKTSVRVPDDVPIQELVSALVTELGLPERTGNGYLIDYKLRFESDGTALESDSTLSNSEVLEGDHLVLEPKPMPAGEPPRSKDVIALEEIWNAMKQEAQVQHSIVSAAGIMHTDRKSLREWWHKILRAHGRFSCFAIFLTLPSDKEALRYLIESGKELNLISGENCLVIALSESVFKCNGFDAKSWQVLAEEHVNDGHSVKVAQMFGIDFSRFPCLLVFRDIRSTEYAAIKLSGMTAEEIATRMRLVFAIIELAIKAKNDPLKELQNQQHIETFRKASREAMNKIGTLTEETFKTTMEAWINAMIK